MPLIVINGATLMCSFGTGPCSLVVIPAGRPRTLNQPTATINDYTPANVPTFIMCTAPTNPQVAAAMGSPVPCVPAIMMPWSPGGSPTLGGVKTLLASDKTTCMWGGMISVANPGTAAENGGVAPPPPGIAGASPAEKIAAIIAEPEKIAAMTVPEIAALFRAAGHNVDVARMDSGRGMKISVSGGPINMVKVHGGGGRHGSRRVELCGNSRDVNAKVIQGSSGTYRGDVAAESRNKRMIFLGDKQQ